MVESSRKSTYPHHDLSIYTDQDEMKPQRNFVRVFLKILLNPFSIDTSYQRIEFTHNNIYFYFRGLYSLVLVSSEHSEYLIMAYTRNEKVGGSMEVALLVLVLMQQAGS